MFLKISGGNCSVDPPLAAGLPHCMRIIREPLATKS